MKKFAAVNFIKKPFSKQGLQQCISEAINAKSIAYHQRFHRDIEWFNQLRSNSQNNDIPMFGFDSIDEQVKKLTKVMQVYESNTEITVPKSNRPNLLFVDDERKIIDIYRDFVKEKPFNTFFSYTLEESREALKNNPST